MQIVNNELLLIKTQFPSRIKETIKGSQVVAQQGDVYEVAVNWGLAEAQTLRQLNIKNVPSPIVRDYDWPGVYKPMDHQKTTASFLTLHRRSFCFNEQGTGKTASAIWASDYLMKLGVIKRVLVVCPLSIMQSAWQADLFKFAIHRTVNVAHGTATKRRDIVNSTAEYVIINYDGVNVVKDEIKGKFDLIVVDECFVAGTLVGTPLGRRPIEQLEAGDKVLTSDGVMRIKRLVRNTTKQLVEVKLGNGKTIRCTPEHPFFTDVGWVCAKNLTGRRLISGVELSCVRAGISPDAVSVRMGYGKQPNDWVNLLKILRSEEVALSESQQERVLQHAARATGETIRTEDRSTSSEVVGSGENQGVQTANTGGQRYGDDINRAVDFRGFTCGVGMELPSSVGEEAARFSYELQARFCLASSQDRVGGGRKQPHSSGTTNARPEEKNEVNGAWVESVSYIECPSGEAVYNIEVEGTPNYFIGDHWLVHNCNAYKNSRTQRFKTMRGLLNEHTYLWMMTGTPAAQSPLDAFGLAKLCVPGRTPLLYTEYRDSVMFQISRFKWIPKPSAIDVVHKLLQPAIRFSKAECLDLPEVTNVSRYAPMTSQQLSHYKQMKKDFIMQAVGEDVSAVNAASNLTKLLQIACGAVYTDAGNVIEFDVSDRMNAVQEVIDEATNKVLIFAPFTHTLALIKDHLTKNGVTSEIIDGSVPVNKRTAIFQRFQETDNPRVLIIQPQAAAHGVTLTAANVVIWYAPVTSIESYLQANARVHRQGQRNPVTVVHIEGSPVEAKLYSMLMSKLDFHSKIIDLYKQEINT